MLSPPFVGAIAIAIAFSVGQAELVTMSTNGEMEQCVGQPWFLGPENCAIALGPPFSLIKSSNKYMKKGLRKDALR